MSIFDLLEERRDAEKQSRSGEGSLNLGEKLRLALCSALKQSTRSRHQVAGEMSHLLGFEISVHQINAWTAESKDGHRFPAEYLPAFCKATGSSEPLELLAEASGMFALPGKDALRSEIQKLREQEESLKTTRRRREIFLREMEGR